jgi:hypothetical protein
LTTLIRVLPVATRQFGGFTWFLLIQSVDEGSARLVNAVQEVAMGLGQSVPLIRTIGLQVKFKFAALTDQF